MRVLINTTNYDHDQVKVKIDITYQRWNQFDLVRNRLYPLWLFSFCGFFFLYLRKQHQKKYSGYNQMSLAIKIVLIFF